MRSTLVLALAIIGLSIHPQARAAEAPPKSPEWTARMRALGTAYGDLLLDLSSDQRFNASANRQRILKNAEKVATAAREMHQNRSESGDADLTIAFVTQQFREDASDAVMMLKSGNRAFARVMLRSMSTYCVACHSRFPTHDLSNWISKPVIDKLPAMDRANYLAASRQFNQAIEAYESVLKEKGGDSIRDYEKAARSSLALKVRVKNDPDGALALVEQVLSSPNTPYFLKEQVKSWKKDLQTWKSESPKKLNSEAALYQEAKRLISAARARQSYPADRSADVLYLRATSVLHRLMTEHPKSVITAEALLMLGQSYEVLGDIGLRDFHESYYVACIKIAPHSPISQNCYAKYEESVYLGYTGSSGTYIPADVRKRLADLELLSVVEPSAKPTAQPLQ